MAGRLTALELDHIANDAMNNIIAFIEEVKETNPELYELALDLAPTWYPYANSLACAGVRMNNYGWNVNQCAGFISALSPMTRWILNIKDYRDYVFDGIRSTYLKTIRVYKCDVIAAMHNPSLEDVQEILRGDKTVSFVDNIVNVGTSKRITIDTIMCQLMKLAKNMLDRVGVYNRIERMIWDLAPEYGFEYGPDFQAFCWILFRGGAE